MIYTIPGRRTPAISGHAKAPQRTVGVNGRNATQTHWIREEYRLGIPSRPQTVYLRHP